VRKYRVMETATVKMIMDHPSAWQGREVDVTGWCLRAIDLSVFADTLRELVSWIPVLGARRASSTGLFLDLQPDALAVFEAATIHLDDLWSEDLQHKWPGDPKLAKLRIWGDVSYEPVPPGKIIVGHYEPIKINAKAVEPLFEGIIEWNDYWHSHEGTRSVNS
jgi:hypothetical protein